MARLGTKRNGAGPRRKVPFIAKVGCDDHGIFAGSWTSPNKGKQIRSVLQGVVYRRN